MNTHSVTLHWLVLCASFNLKLLLAILISYNLFAEKSAMHENQINFGYVCRALTSQTFLTRFLSSIHWKKIYFINRNYVQQFPLFVSALLHETYKTNTYYKEIQYIYAFTTHNKICPSLVNPKIMHLTLYKRTLKCSTITLCLEADLPITF